MGAKLSSGGGDRYQEEANAENYVTQAVALAQDPDARARLRHYLAGPGRQSPLFDTERSTRALESAYLAMADQYRRDVREPIDVR